MNPTNPTREAQPSATVADKLAQNIAPSWEESAALLLELQQANARERDLKDELAKLREATDPFVLDNLNILRDNARAMRAKLNAAEAELARCKDLASERTDQANGFEQAVIAAQAELARLKADSARIDWLEKHLMSLHRPTSPDMSGINTIGQCHNPAKEMGEAGPSFIRIQGRSIRDAITSAMRSGGEGDRT